MRLRLLSKSVLSLIAATALCAVVSRAEATQLMGSVGTDNGAYIYLSTNQSTLGTLIGTASSWAGTPVSAGTLTPGSTYYLNVEAYNVGGPGGFIGTFSLSDASYQFSNGTQSLNTGIVGWLGAYNSALPNGVTTAPSGPPATWSTPNAAVYSQGLNGISPWGTVAGVSANADWIWPSDSQSLPSGSPCQYCWVDFSSTAITPVPTAQSIGVPEPLGPSLLSAALIGLGVARKKRIILG